MSAPSVVWITLDSVRYDRTSMAGHHRDTTPELRRIAATPRGESFADCISPAYATKPFTGSVLTGKFPPVVDVYSNGAIPDSLRRIPERFAEAGYRTAGLSMNAHVGPAIGADRGFDRFRQNLPSNMADPSLLPVYLTYLRNLPAITNRLSLDKWQYSTAFLMTELAKRTLDSLHGEGSPFFFYAHYIEPHRPYVPPRPERREFAADIEMAGTDAADFALAVHEEHDRHIANYCDFAPAEWEALRAMYDAELAHTDGLMGELFEFGRSLGLDDAVWVFTADHGELLGERDFVGHKHYVDDPLVHVPMVTHGFEPAAADPDDVVQHLDVVKTLLSRAGAPTDGVHGVDLDDGRREFAVSYRGTECNFDPYRAHNPEFEPEGYMPGRLFGLRTRRYKYLSNGETEHLARLPEEYTDVSEDRPDVARKFADRLRDWRAAHDHPIEDPTDRELSAEVETQLEDLGYRV